MNTHDPLLGALRAANPVRPSADAAGHPRAAEILAAILASPKGEPAMSLARRPRRRVRRSLAIAITGAVVVSGIAYGAVRWGEDDLPTGGTGPSAFVLPSTSILPDGTFSTAPPAYADLPVRPAIVFAAGVSYRDAVRLYYDARQRGEILPPGAALADPLPEGKVVLIEGGRVHLDPAAPVGYDLGTGRVAGFSAGVPAASLPAPPLARCQVLLGVGDPDSRACPAAPATVAQVQEIDGRWQAVGPLSTENAPPPSTTALAVLARPLSEQDRVPEVWRDPAVYPQFADSGADLDQARLALERDGVRYFVVPADDQVCLVAAGPAATATTCNPLGVLATDGAIPLVFTTPGEDETYAALVGDGWSEAVTGDGRRAPVVSNVVAVADVRRGISITLVGPSKERVVRNG